MPFNSGQTLPASSLAPLDNPPYCELFANATTSFTANTFVKCALGQVVEDTATMASAGTSEIVITKAGRYLLQAQISLQFNASGGRGLFLAVNGNYKASQTVAANPADSARISLSKTVRLLIGDRLTIAAYCTVTISNELTAYGGSYLSALYVGA